MIHGLELDVAMKEISPRVCVCVDGYFNPFPLIAQCATGMQPVSRVPSVRLSQRRLLITAIIHTHSAFGGNSIGVEHLFWKYDYKVLSYRSTERPLT